MADETVVAAPAPTTTPEAAVAETVAPETGEAPATPAPKLTAAEAAEKWRRPAKPEGGKTAREAREALAKRLNSPNEARTVAPEATPESAAEPVAEATTEQPRDEQGRFAPKEPEAAATAPVTEAPKEGRIPIPAGHTIAETRGKQYLDELELHELKPFVSDAAWQKISASLRAENVARQEAQRTQELQSQLARERARAEVLSDPATDPLADPVKRALYEDIKAKYSVEEADRYLASLKNEREQLVARKSEELSRSMEAENKARAFLASVNEVKDTFARQRYAAWGTDLDSELNRVLDVFVPLVEQGREQPTREAFYRFADMLYIQDPRGRQAVEGAAKAERDRIAAEAREKARIEAETAAKAAEAERLRLAATNQRVNPLGAAGSGNAAPQNTRPTSAADARRSLEARYRNSMLGR